MGRVSDLLKQKDKTAANDSNKGVVGSSLKERADILSGKIDIETIGKRLQERIKSWSNNYQEYAGSASSRFKDYDYSKYRRAESSKGTLLAGAQAAWFKMEADNINSLLSKYEEYFNPDWASNVRTYLSNAIKYTEDVFSAYKSETEYWSQWDSEDAYYNDYYSNKYAGKTYDEIVEAWQNTTGKERSWLIDNAENFKSSVELQEEISYLNEKYDFNKPLISQIMEHGFGDVSDFLGFTGGEGTREWARSEIKRLEGLRDTKKRTETKAKYEQYMSDALAWYKELHGPRMPIFNDRSLESIQAKKSEIDNIKEHKAPVTLPAIDGRNTEHMTHGQKVLYHYLKEHPEVGDADEYLKAIQVDLDKADKEASDRMYADMLDNGNFFEKLALQVGSVGGNIAGGVGAFVEDTFNTLVGNSINPYSPAHEMLNMASTVRSETAKNIAEDTNWEIGGYNVASSLYSFGMSAVDSYLGGQGLGKAYLLLAGTNAASNKMSELYERGASNEQIFINGLLSGAAEIAIEKIPLDNLLKPKTSATFLQGLKEMAKQAGLEGIEEGLTESANILFDEIIMGDKSQLSLTIKKYQTGYYDEKGVWHDPISAEEATKKAYTETLGEILYSTVGGLISGGMIAGPGIATQTAVNSYELKNTGKSILNTPNGYDALKVLAEQMHSDGATEADALIDRLAAKTQKGVDAIKKGTASKHQIKTTARDVGRLSESVNSARNAQNLAEIQSVLESKGVDSSKAKNAAELLNRLLYDNELTKSEYKTLMSDERVYDTYRELVSSSDSTLKSRNVKHMLGRMGITTNADGTHTIASLADNGSVTTPNSESNTKDTAKKSNYTVSSDGVTRMIDGGEAVEIADVVSIDGSGVTVKLSNGKKVNATALSFATEEEAELYSQLSSYIKDNLYDIHPSAAKDIIGSYDASFGISPAEYLKAAAIAYTFGKYNIPKRELSDVLSEEQKHHLYKLGQVFTENKVKQSEERIKAAEKEKRISARTSESERAEILKRKVIKNVPVSKSLSNSKVIESWSQLSDLFGKHKREVIKKLASEFGVFKSYLNDDISLEFEFSKNSFDESYSKQKRKYEDFAKMLSVFDDVVKSAIGIEAHLRENYKPDPTLKNVYVLMSAYLDGDYVVPVKLEIKEFVDKSNKLYVAVTTDKIKIAEVSKQGTTENGVAQNSRSATLTGISGQGTTENGVAQGSPPVNISITDLMRKVNPEETSFTKYFPDSLLTDAQRAALEEKGYKRESSNNDNVHKSSKNTGKLIFEKGVRADRNNQKLSLRVLNLLAKRLGLTIHVYKSNMVDGERVYTRSDGTVISGKNGWYDTKTGEIWLDINAGTTGQGLILFTASHELVHFIRQWSESKFKVLADFLVEKYGEAGNSVDDLIHQQMNSRGIGYDEAYEEVIASSMESMLKDGKVLEKLAELEKKDHGIVNKIRSFLKKFAAKLKAAYDGIDPATEEGQFFVEMTEEADRIAQLFAEALHDAGENFKKTDVSKFETSDNSSNVRYSEIGTAEDGRKIYESNFPKGTPKSAKSDRILDYIKNVWSKKPISLVISNGETSRTILAQFDPTIDEGQNTPTDASKLAGGNRHGTHAEQRVTLDLADDYYSIASEAKYNYSKLETGKKSDTHTDVKMWHYFVNDIYFAEYGETEYTPYTVTINVKEKDSGDFVYSFNAEKESPTRRTLHAGVNTRKGANGELFIDDSISQNDPTVNSKDMQNIEKYSSASTDVSTRGLLVNALESAAKTDAEREKLAKYKAKISEIEALEQRLDKLFEKKGELTGVNGKRDMDAISSLNREIKEVQEQIDRADAALLKLESMRELKDLVARERDRAYDEGRKQANEQRKRAEIRRQKTVERNKIQKVAHDLERLLNNGTKERNVKAELRDVVRLAVEVAQVMFIDNETMIMNGRIETSHSPDEEAKINRYRELVEEIRATDDDVAENREKRSELFHERNLLDNELKDLFAREKMRITEASAKGVIDKLVVAFKSLETSNNDYIKALYDEAVEKHLSSIGEFVGSTLVKDMSLAQLEEVYRAFVLIRHKVTTANQLFRDGKYEDSEKRIASVQEQVGETAAKDKDPNAFVGKLIDGAKSFVWNDHRPVDAFHHLGSESMEELYWDCVYAQDTYGRITEEAAIAIVNARVKYGYKSWQLNVAETFTTTDGVKFKVTLADKLSIYATFKRDQGYGHMTQGGFVREAKAEYVDEDGGKKLHRTTSKPYRLSESDIGKIVESLGKEHKEYVDTLVSYMTKLGEEGNKVSRILYGIDLFTEKYYFPIQSSKDYLGTPLVDLGKKKSMVMLKNTGMTKRTVAGANNPIVLRAFDDVVLEHIDTMAKYCAYVIPIENLQKVFNGMSKDSSGNLIATKMLIQAKYGTGAEKYFEQYITDLNGGNEISDAKSPFVRFFNRNKGMAVAANVSVVVQQYFSIFRAMAEVDVQYFIPFLHGEASKTNDDSLWAEMNKYAPVSVLKERGGFDMGKDSSFKNSVAYKETRLSLKKAGKWVEDKLGSGASLMDRWGWETIYRAVKKEIAATTDLKIGSEEFLQACGKRFTEVVTKTQVYDSVNTRSGFMRSKSDFVKMATSFFGEPTVIVNMAYTACLDLLRADKGSRAKAFKKLCVVSAVLSVATALNSLAVALVRAMRDDEEDEAFLERWSRHYGAALIEELNVFEKLPFLSDVSSAWQGYNSERSDMALIEDTVSAIKKITDGDITSSDSMYTAGALGNIVGIPAKNIIRDLGAMVRVVGDITDDVEPTDIGGAFVRGVTNTSRTKSQKLYFALKNGDKGRLEKLREGYKDDASYEKAVKMAIRENDGRVKAQVKSFANSDFSGINATVDVLTEIFGISENLAAEIVYAEYGYYTDKITEAAEALRDGDKSSYSNIVKKLSDRYRGTISFDEIVNTVKKEKENLPEISYDDVEDDESVYRIWQVNASLEEGDTESASSIIEDIVYVKVNNYIEDAKKEAEENGTRFNERQAEKEAENKARGTVKSSVTKYWKARYQAAWKSNDADEMARIRNLLTATGLYDNVTSTVRDWLKETANK